MITEEDKKEIANLIESFIQKMHEWELSCWKIDEDITLTFDEKFQKQKSEVSIIFEKYCTKKERKFGRPTTISYGSEYHPEKEKIITIEEQSKNKAIVYTETTDVALPSKHQYGVVRKNEKWLLDTKKRYSTSKKKWLVDSL